MENIIKGHSTPIETKNIEQSLKNLWKKHQKNSGLRATLFNLIIYTRENERTDYLQKMIEGLIKKFPCRILLITEYNRNKEDGFLKTYVSDVKASDDDSIFCEMIQFHVAGSYKERISFVTLPHIQPDLPVYLLWTLDPNIKHPSTLKLDNYITRTIFDSESTNHFSDFAHTLLSYHNYKMHDLGDLNWARTHAWRELLITAFNSYERLELLKNTKEITITYNNISSDSFSHTKIQSTYIQAWIASKMKWSLQSQLSMEQELIFTYKDNKGVKTVRVIPDSMTQVEPGRILSINIKSENDDYIILKRDQEETRKVEITFNFKNLEIPPFIHQFDQEKTGRTMAHEIYKQGTNSSFIDTLMQISQYKHDKVCC